MCVCAGVCIDALTAAAPVACNPVCAGTGGHVCGRRLRTGTQGGRKWCTASRVPAPQVAAGPLKQRGTTAVPGVRGGTHARGRAADTGRAPPVRLCLRAPAPAAPRGTCLHTRVRHAGWACKERHSSEVDVPQRPAAGLFRVSFQLYLAPLHRLCGRMRVRGAGGEVGGQRAPACCAHARVPPRPCRRPSVPFIYSNINIFAFRPQPKRDKALPRGLSAPPRLIRLQTQLGLSGTALDAFVLPKRA